VHSSKAKIETKMRKLEMAIDEKDNCSNQSIVHQIDRKTIINVHQGYMGTCEIYIRVLIGFKKKIIGCHAY
jgi:hypothetical protein